MIGNRRRRRSLDRCAALVAVALVVTACGSGSGGHAAKDRAEKPGRTTSTSRPATTAKTAKGAVPLHEAIANGDVAATFTAKGGFAGPIVQMTLRRTARGTALVRVSGLVLRSTEAEEQDLGVLGVADPRSAAAGAMIRLDDNASHDYTLLAFCFQPQRRQPTAGRTLQPAGLAQPRVQTVLEAAAELIEKGASTLAVQAAVYRVTNGWTVADFNKGLTFDRGGKIEKISFGTLTPADVEAARGILTRAAKLSGEFVPLLGVAIDTTVAPFDDPEVVRALGMAIPEGVLEEIGYRGIAIVPGGPRRIGPTGGADGFWPNWAVTDGVPAARPDPSGAAKRVADWEAKHGPMKVTLLAPEIVNLFPRPNRALSVIEHSWKQAGIEVHSIATEWDPIRVGETERVIRSRSNNPAAAFAAIVVAPPAFAELPDD